MNSMKKFIGHYLLTSALVLLFSGVGSFANANNYNVSPIGSDTVCNGTANAPATAAPNCAFLTITKAVNIAKAGDNVSIQPGTYSENVNFSNSGTAAAPITFTGTTSAVITSTAPITSTGVTTPIIAGNVITKGNYLTIQGLTFSPPTGKGPFSYYYAVYLYGNYNLINNCVITNYGALDSDQATGFGMDSNSAYNIFQHSSIVNLAGIDAMHIFGHDQKIQHNYVDSINTVSGGTNHVDFIQSWGYSGSYSYNILIDGNVISNSQAQAGNLSYDGVSGVHDWTFSNNVFWNVENALFVGIPRTYFYNNLFYQSGISGYGIAFYVTGAYNSEGDILANNVFIINTAIQGANSQGWIFNGYAPAVFTLSKNYYATTANTPILQNKVGPTDINGGGDPMFVNAAAGNFNLQAGSILIGKGLNLSSLFTNDAAGNTRTTVWDIGPYAYNSTTGAVTLSPPSGLTVN